LHLNFIKSNTSGHVSDSISCAIQFLKSFTSSDQIFHHIPFLHYSMTCTYLVSEHVLGSFQWLLYAWKYMYDVIFWFIVQYKITIVKLC
jgi:hypothetical protein